MLIPSTWTHRLTRAYTSTLNTSQVFHKHNSAVLFGKRNCSVVGYFCTATKPRLRGASWSIIAPRSTAWLLDTEDRLATRIAQDGVPLPIHIEDTNTSFSVEWKGGYRVEGTAFIYADKGTARVVSILGYPTDRLSSST